MGVDFEVVPGGAWVAGGSGELFAWLGGLERRAFAYISGLYKKVGNNKIRVMRVS